MNDENLVTIQLLFAIAKNLGLSNSELTRLIWSTFPRADQDDLRVRLISTLGW